MRTAASHPDESKLRGSIATAMNSASRRAAGSQACIHAASALAARTHAVAVDGGQDAKPPQGKGPAAASGRSQTEKGGARGWPAIHAKGVRRAR